MVRPSWLRPSPSPRGLLHKRLLESTSRFVTFPWQRDLSLSFPRCVPSTCSPCLAGKAIKHGRRARRMPAPPALHVLAGKPKMAAGCCTRWCNQPGSLLCVAGSTHSDGCQATIPLWRCVRRGPLRLQWKGQSDKNDLARLPEHPLPQWWWTPTCLLPLSGCEVWTPPSAMEGPVREK